ncbi:hypothetical protein [Mycetocola sp.]|uniref:hypothetical protein n=1 Tax=Mycetocola sp. TaxID=1871042 RepID=UPI003989AA68
MLDRWLSRLNAIVWCAATAVLSGCAASAPAELPDGVRVEVLQGRTDYTSGTLVIRVVNESGSDLALQSARVSWPGFSAPAEWERGTTVRSGTTVDLRAPVPDVECDGATAEPVAVLSFLDGQARATASVPVADPLATLERLRGEGCIAEQVERVAAVSVGSLVVEGEGRASVAVVTLTFAPTGAEGRVEVEGVSSTPLLRPDPATHQNAEDWPLDVSVDAASGSVTAELRIVPARCDAHAIADDKVGTVFNIAVRLSDGTAGEYRLIPRDGVREELLNYVRATCGLL